MKRTRVLVVEDSLTVRKRLCEVLGGDPAIELVGDVGDGAQAIELCRRLRPDVITMDMMMPTLDGLAATEQIMAHCPTPILIVSSSTNRGELFKTLDALAAGAVDVLEKPRGDDSDAAWAVRFLATVKLVSRIRAITHPRARLGGLGRSPSSSPAAIAAGGAARECRVVAIGASTGGPAAILEVLQALPSDYPLPVLLVIHIGKPFGVAFADWLASQSGRRVAFALEGESFRNTGGRVLMAPPDQHLLVRDGRLHLTSEPERHSCRPSVTCSSSRWRASSAAPRRRAS